MKKKIFTLIFFMASILWISIGAAQEGRYVRKKLQPGFFMPQSAADKPEQLPEFNRYPLKELQEQQEELERKKKALEQQAAAMGLEENINKETDESVETAASDVPETEAAGQSIEVDNFIPIEESEYVSFLENSNFNDLPLYRQKYTEYINALNAIAETGIMPENETTTTDLAKMNSNQKILIDENFGIRQ